MTKSSAAEVGHDEGTMAQGSAMRLARLVIQAHAAHEPATVAADLLAMLVAITGAGRGALALIFMARVGAEPPEPRLLAAHGDVVTLRAALDPHSDGIAREQVRLAIPLEVRHPQGDGAGGEGPSELVVLLHWDDVPTEHQAAEIQRTLGELRDSIAAVVASLLAAEQRAALTRLAEERAVALAAADAARTDWEQTVDAVSDPIAVISTDYQVRRVNAAYRQRFGLGAELPARHACFAVHDGSTAPCSGCPLPSTVQTGRPGYVEREGLVAVGPDQTLASRRFQIWTYPVRDAAGQVDRVVEIMKDVTEQESLRQLSAQAEALRAADHLKAELLGTVSHELRSPLAAIKGYASTLLRHERRLPRAERHEFLTAIGEASTRLEAIINRLLEMSQLETGDVVISRSALDLVPIVRDAIAEQRAKANANNRPAISFTLTLRDQAGALADHEPLIFADARAMRALLDNLLENAVKYSPRGGTIAIDIRPMRGDQARVLVDDLRLSSGSGAHEPQIFAGQDEVLAVTVSDTGVGIPTEHLGRIFDRFHRVDTRLTREVDGLGLGLAICRRLVELHAGAIWAESEPGAGSVFHVLLPAATPADQQAGPEEE